MRTIHPNPSGDAIDRELWSIIDDVRRAARRFRRDRVVLGGALAGGYLAAAVELAGAGRPWVAFLIAFYAGPLAGLGAVTGLDRLSPRLR